MPRLLLLKSFSQVSLLIIMVYISLQIQNHCFNLLILLHFALIAQHIYKLRSHELSLTMIFCVSCNSFIF